MEDRFLGWFCKVLWFLSITFCIGAVIWLCSFCHCHKKNQKRLAKPTCAWFCALLSIVLFQRFTLGLFRLNWLDLCFVDSDSVKSVIIFYHFLCMYITVFRLHRVCLFFTQKYICQFWCGCEWGIFLFFCGFVVIIDYHLVL